MNRTTIVLLLFVLATSGAVSAAAPSLAQPAPSVQQDVNQRLDRLAQQVDRLESRLSSSRNASGVIFMLFGAFCALWAQNTRRDPWLWFFLGALLNVFAVIAVLMKNGEDLSPQGGSNRRAWVLLGILLALVAATFVILWLSSFTR